MSVDDDEWEGIDDQQKSFDDAEEFAAFVGRDQELPKLTGEALGEELRHAEFRLRSERNMDWVAMATRRALAATIQPASDASERPANVDVREELKAFATKVGRATSAITKRSDYADDQLWRRALRASSLQAGPGKGTDPEEWTRFLSVLNEMAWLEKYLAHAASECQAQRPKWREAELRELRIQQGQYLFPVFESAFYPVRITTFTDFYQRVIELAFEKEEIPDLEALMREVKRRHDAAPVVFNPAVIPGF